MKILWCWKCEKDAPMLDEDEFVIVGDIYSECMEEAAKCREGQFSSLSSAQMDEIFSPVRNKYEEMTGVKENNHVAIMHHRLSAFGDPCKKCGKPLRSSKASLCAACGWDQEK